MIGFSPSTDTAHEAAPKPIEVTASDPASGCRSLSIRLTFHQGNFFIHPSFLSHHIPGGGEEPGLETALISITETLRI